MGIAASWMLKPLAGWGFGVETKRKENGAKCSTKFQSAPQWTSAEQDQAVALTEGKVAYDDSVGGATGTWPKNDDSGQRRVNKGRQEKVKRAWAL